MWVVVCRGCCKIAVEGKISVNVSSTRPNSASIDTEYQTTQQSDISGKERKCVNEISHTSSQRFSYTLSNKPTIDQQIVDLLYYVA
jgi:hypothetical protein